MTVSSSDARERRQYRRFPAANLKAQMRHKKGLFGDSWVDVEVLDFSSHGIAVSLNEEPKMSQEVTFRLILEMDMGEITINRLEAMSRNKSYSGDSWRVGCEYMLDSNQAKKDGVETKLERIGRILEKSSAVNSRLQSQINNAE